MADFGMKRSADSERVGYGNDFGKRDEIVDKPKQATAAQLAARKIKQPRGRSAARSSTTASSQPAFGASTNSPFNSINANALANNPSQPSTGFGFGASVGGTNGASQANNPPASSTFNFNSTTSFSGSNPFASISANNSSAPPAFSSNIFNLSKENQPPTNNNQTPSFSFGSDTSKPAEPSKIFGFGQQPAAPQSNGLSFGAETNSNNNSNSLFNSQPSLLQNPTSSDATMTSPEKPSGGNASQPPTFGSSIAQPKFQFGQTATQNGNAESSAKSSTFGIPKSTDQQNKDSSSSASTAFKASTFANPTSSTTFQPSLFNNPTQKNGDANKDASKPASSLFGTSTSGAAQTPSSGFNFGNVTSTQSGAQASTPSFSFGQPSKSAETTGNKVNDKPSAPTAGTPQFLFGQSSSKPEDPKEINKAAAPKSNFSFGQSTFGQVPATSERLQGPSFAFGQPAAQAETPKQSEPAKAPEPAKTPAFNFGNASSQAQTPAATGNVSAPPAQQTAQTPKATPPNAFVPTTNPNGAAQETRIPRGETRFVENPTHGHETIPVVVNQRIDRRLVTGANDHTQGSFHPSNDGAPAYMSSITDDDRDWRVNLNLTITGTIRPPHGFEGNALADFRPVTIELGQSRPASNTSNRFANALASAESASRTSTPSAGNSTPSTNAASTTSRAPETNPAARATPNIEQFQPSNLPSYLNEEGRIQVERAMKLRALNTLFQKKLASLDAGSADIDELVRFYATCRSDIGSELGLYQRATAGQKRKAQGAAQTPDPAEAFKRARAEPSVAAPNPAASELQFQPQSSVTPSDDVFSQSAPASTASRSVTNLFHTAATSAPSTDKAADTTTAGPSTSNIFGTQSVAPAPAASSNLFQPAAPSSGSNVMAANPPVFSASSSNLFGTQSTASAQATAPKPPSFTPSTPSASFKPTTAPATAPSFKPSTTATPAFTGFKPNLTPGPSGSGAQMPKLGTASGSDFFSQFGQKSQKNVEALRKEKREKRKAEDFDSDEDDEAEFDKKLEEEERAKRARLEEAAKSSSNFFTFKPSPTAEANKPEGSIRTRPENPKASSWFGDSGSETPTSTTDGKSVFDQSAPASTTQYANPFASLQGSEVGHDDDDDEEELVHEERHRPSYGEQYHDNGSDLEDYSDYEAYEHDYPEDETETNLDATQDTYQEVTQDVAEDYTEDVTQDETEDYTEDVTQEESYQDNEKTDPSFDPDQESGAVSDDDSTSDDDDFQKAIRKPMPEKARLPEKPFNVNEPLGKSLFDGKRKRKADPLDAPGAEPPRKRSKSPPHQRLILNPPADPEANSGANTQPEKPKSLFDRLTPKPAGYTEDDSGAEEPTPEPAPKSRSLFDRITPKPPGWTENYSDAEDSAEKSKSAFGRYSPKTAADLSPFASAGLSSTAPKFNFSSAANSASAFGSASVLGGASPSAGGDTQNSSLRSLFGSSPAQPTDRTWKPESPIKFGTVNGPPAVSVTAASPAKPFSNLFGASTSNTSSTTPKPPSVGFNFGAPSASNMSSLAPSVFSSAGTSRATSPADNSANETDAEDAPKDEQVSLMDSRPGEENEEVLYEVRAKLMKQDESTKNWVSMGVGPLRILRDKDTAKVRMVLRADPGANVILNSSVHKGVEYKPMTNGAGKDTAAMRFADFDNNGNLLQRVLKVKTIAEVQKIAEILSSSAS